MYTIIGGDGKQYGPISEAELRKWVAEGRLSGQSLAKAESDAEFRPLATFPEFSATMGIAPPPLSQPPPLGGGMDGREAALQKVKAPAIGLIVSASLSVVMALWGLIQLLFSSTNIQQVDSELAQLNNPQLQELADKILQFFYGPFGIVNQIFQLIIAALILIGAIKMLKLRSYPFAYSAAILSVVPCITPCCGWVIALIFGFWAMAVLSKPHVKSYFE